jgi:hypothetical protein
MRYSKPRIYKHTSRYGKYRQIIDNNAYIETFNETTVDKSNNDKLHIVTPQQENRLDIIANIYYSDPSFSWVIALSNDIIDPFIIKAGTTLRIPPIESLYNTKGALYKHG